MMTDLQKFTGYDLLNGYDDQGMIPESPSPIMLAHWLAEKTGYDLLEVALPIVRLWLS